MDVSSLSSRGRGARVALAISVSLNIVLLVVVLLPEPEPEPIDEPSSVAGAAATVEPTATPEVAAAASDEPASEDSTDEPTASETDAEPSDVQVTVASVEGSIPQTMAVAAKPYGEFVSATLSRLLAWDLDLRRDLRAGDRVEVAWSLGTSDTVVIEAARYETQKHARTITAYRFQATGDEYPSYWSAQGVEVPHRLKETPLANYEQITSLLKDRPNHHGMDFKTPTGTPVLATRGGVVTRANWNWNANGNCIEIRHADGVLAKYLHLSDNKVQAGDRVSPGDVVALSGNTGHSTGPHLHYQLNEGSKVLDPIDYHGTERRELPEGDREAFAKVVADADKRFATAGKLAAK